MRSIILIFISLLCANLLAQEIEVPYKFPVVPGTEEWEQLTSSRQMDEVCIIPNDILDRLSTEALLVTCLHYPRLIDVFLMDNLQSGFDFYSNHFDGLKELIERLDLSSILLHTYLELNLEDAQIKKYEFNLNLFHLAFLELMIAQDNIISQFNENEKVMLLKDAIRKLGVRKANNEDLYWQKTTALIISRILQSQKRMPTEVNAYGMDIFQVFNSYVVLSDSTVIDKILLTSKGIILE